MNKLPRVISFIIIVLLLILPIKALDLAEIGKFGFGFASAVYVHEAGHALAIWLEGGEVEEIGFAYTRWNLPDNINQEEREGRLRNMYLGGYLSQSLLSEIILQNKEWHKDSFMLGMMSMGLYANLSNPIRYYIFGERDFDLGFYKKYGGDPLIPSLLMAGYSIFSIYRIFNDTNIVPYINDKVIGFSLSF